jgi:Zn-dependent protease with chaperone function
MRPLLILAFVLCNLVCIGQSTPPFQPIPVIDTIPAELYRQFKLKNETDKKAVSTPGKAGNYLKSLYDQRLTYQISMFNQDLILMDDDISRFLTTIQNKIYHANPELAHETTIYPYRSETPNALSMGNGTLCFMLGLLSRLETEDQVAFVLCHELAHHHRKHTELKMTQLANTNYDKELKKKIDAIMASPYNRHSRLKSLFSSLDISFSKHSRFAEYEADSIGLVYYRRTGYNPYAPLRVMQILDQADSAVYTENIDLRKVFSFTDFKFKDSWLEYRKSDVWHAPLRLTDSDTASTHPDCKKRFEALKGLLAAENVDDDEIKKGIPTDPIRMQASLEIIHSQYHFKQYGKSLFNALILSEKYPENTWLHAMIGKSLYQLYQAQKNHVLGKSLELPDPRFPENYDRFLTFIHRLRLSEVAGLAYNYITTRPENDFDNEEFIHALWLCSRLEGSKLDPEKVRTAYESLYPGGKYSREMKLL